ncbi:MAG: DNA-processing protein DprA [Acidimicrobiia bacterium]|nr:DNA-processing protein DprA [Acidimicrobiia bacterium]MCY4434633.1 DNA-processing protein DprA [bacterium]
MSAHRFASAGIHAHEGGELPVEAWLAALASLPAVGPARLRALLAIDRPAELWASLQGPPSPELAKVAGKRDLYEQWRRTAVGLDVARLWARHRECGIGVAALGTPGYPSVLRDDLDPPAVVFHKGDPQVVHGPRVAIVGTRRCTRYGSDVAFELGRDLASAGVGVVSGLALGIDAAAHAGTLDAGAAPPIAVVGNGLDRVYPERNRALWRAVADQGVLLGEAPLGAPPERWRFPARNRIIAALADVVVVVESHASGGAMHTVTEAAARNRAVMAVPGPVRSSASDGCHGLLADGCAPCRDGDDVLLALGMSGAVNAPLDSRPDPGETGRQVLEALGWQPADAEQLNGRTGLTMAQVAGAVEELRIAGWVAVSGRWIERVGLPR